MKLSTLILLLLFSSMLFAEDKNVFFTKDTVVLDSISQIDKKIPNELVFLDLIGNVYGVTLCYEKNIYKIDNYQRLYFHTGFGLTLGLLSIDGAGIPITLNYVAGKNYCFEAELGIMLYGNFYDSRIKGVYGKDLVKIISNICYRYHSMDKDNFAKVFKIGIGNTYQFNPSPVTPNFRFVPTLIFSIDFDTSIFHKRIM